MGTIPKNQIKEAGLAIIGKSSIIDTEKAFEILGDFRSQHIYPINTFQATLRKRVKDLGFYKKAIISQRLKRIPSIINKLNRHTHIKLTSIQDIGGLRVVLDDMNQLTTLVNRYKNTKGFSHELVREDDYIGNPKDSGYRSHHLIYKYNSKSNSDYNGLFLEIQFRTKLQHAWATCVEILGSVYGEDFKSSSGSKDLLSFFKLSSAAFSCLENLPLNAEFEKSTKNDIFRELIMEIHRLGIIDKLRGYSTAFKVIHNSQKINSKSYFLITLDTSKKTLNIKTYGKSKNEKEKANLDYLEFEENYKKDIYKQIVLVSLSNTKKLQQAYPNYYLDSGKFIDTLIKIQKIYNGIK